MKKKHLLHIKMVILSMIAFSTVQGCSSSKKTDPDAPVETSDALESFCNSICDRFGDCGNLYEDEIGTGDDCVAFCLEQTTPGTDYSECTTPQSNVDACKSGLADIACDDFPPSIDNEIDLPAECNAIIGSCEDTTDDGGTDDTLEVTQTVVDEFCDAVCEKVVTNCSQDYDEFNGDCATFCSTQITPDSGLESCPDITQQILDECTTSLNALSCDDVPESAGDDSDINGLGDLFPDSCKMICPQDSSGGDGTSM